MPAKLHFQRRLSGSTRIRFAGRLVAAGLLVAAVLAGAIAARSPLSVRAGPPAADAKASPKKKESAGLTIAWKDNFLTVHGQELPGGSMSIMYLEAYCRPGSTDREWGQTVIGHQTRLVAASQDAKRIELACKLNDGVEVQHVIEAGDDEVDFQLTAVNPTDKPSLADWAQPCIRVDKFTGKDKLEYIPNCFIFLDGRLARLPTEPWATKARYIPGQVYRAKGVDANDVNPRPLSELIPSSGLCGCFSGDERWIMATAWEPYQEIFQGVAHCMHADFRIGGLKPGETKKIRGKLYLVPAEVDTLVARYEQDFPEHVENKP